MAVCDLPSRTPHAWGAAGPTGRAAGQRLLGGTGVDEVYEGHVEVTAGDHHGEGTDSRPGAFPCCDPDARPASTAVRNEVSGDLEGAVGGGLSDPHSAERFLGYDSESKEFSAGVCQKHTTGQNDADYTCYTVAEDGDAYKKQFSQYTRNTTPPDTTGRHTRTLTLDYGRGEPSLADTPKKAGTKKGWSTTKRLLPRRKSGH